MHRTRQLREEMGLTQVRLAVRADMNPATLNRIEMGKANPNLKTLERLADALGVTVSALVEDDPGPKEVAPPSLADWFEERCGHSYLAMNKDALEEMFERLPEEGPERRALGLEINQEYNAFCSFPRNVTTEERVLMRRVIRASISDVAVKHQLALHESGLYAEYSEELRRVFELERNLDADAIA